MLVMLLWSCRLSFVLRKIPVVWFQSSILGKSRQSSAYAQSAVVLAIPAESQGAASCSVREFVQPLPWVPQERVGNTKHTQMVQAELSELLRQHGVQLPTSWVPGSFPAKWKGRWKRQAWDGELGKKMGLCCWGGDGTREWKRWELGVTANVIWPFPQKVGVFALWELFVS